MAIDFQDLRIDQNLIPWNDLKLQGEVPRKLYFPRDVKLGLEAPVLLGPNGAILARGDTSGGQLVSPSSPYTSDLKNFVNDDGTISSAVPSFPVSTVSSKAQKNVLTNQVLTATYTSPTFDSAHQGTVGVLIICTAVSGTTPTLGVNIDALMSDGTSWANVGSALNITATQTIGLQAAALVRVRYFRIRLVIGGTTPSYTVTMDYFVN